MAACLSIAHMASALHTQLPAALAMAPQGALEPPQLQLPLAPPLTLPCAEHMPCRWKKEQKKKKKEKKAKKDKKAKKEKRSKHKKRSRRSGSGSSGSSSGSESD